MIEDLQRQVAKLTQRRAAQNMEMYRNIDGYDSESNFANPYHNPVLFWFRNTVVKMKNLLMKSFNMKKTLKIILNVL
jgi:hypothetical protein